MTGLRIRYVQTLGAVAGIPGYEMVTVVEITVERPKDPAIVVEVSGEPVVIECRRPGDIVLDVKVNPVWMGGI